MKGCSRVQIAVIYEERADGAVLMSEVMHDILETYFNQRDLRAVTRVLLCGG